MDARFRRAFVCGTVLMLAGAAWCGAADAPVPAAAAKQPVAVAVLDFEPVGEKVAEMGRQIAALLAVRLSNDADLLLVERQDLEKILSEQEIGLSGTISSDTAAKIGHLTGAKVLVGGRVFESARRIAFVARVIGTETGRMYAESVAMAGEGSIDLAARDLSARVAAIVKGRKQSLLAPDEAPDDLVARLRKDVAGKRLPSVGVRMAEVHFGQPVIDPAIETELCSILSAVGFTVVDTEKSRKPAEILITGEGFSEFATRRGNLVSCKGRVEMKAGRSGSDAILAVDHQTEVAVDVAEHIAGKNALIKATRKLAERIVPRLALK